jgi:hypothetical protein
MRDPGAVYRTKVSPACQFKEPAYLPSAGHSPAPNLLCHSL